MPAPTVVDAAGENPRAGALSRRIAQLAPAAAAERLDAISLGLVDAMLAADAGALTAALDDLRDARARTLEDAAQPEERQRLLGWLEAAIALAHWGLERLVPEAPAVAPGTQARHFLAAIGEADAGQLSSADLRRLLHTDETQVSRTGRRLLDAGLVVRRKVGRQVFWAVSPRGRLALRSAAAAAPEKRAGPGKDFWMEAIRQGFRGAGGDEPAPERREVDPTLEHLVSTTLQLHTMQGIQATTWTDIAARAGVPLETVEAYFPTQDDLIRSCGRHFLSSLRIPPPDRADEVIDEAAPEPERIRRLVGTLFDVYERQGDALEVGRRERNDLPLVDEALGQVDVSLDALVSRALGGPDSGSVTAVRALTDIAVWRALRERGATAADSIEQASDAVERWLATRPATRAPAS